jgi:hypothetical protein
VPEVFLVRQDGFVKVFNLADGSSLERINIGEPILGLAMLKGKDGKPCLAIGTKFSVQLFGPDLKKLGGSVLPVPPIAFAGPGGKDKDSVFVIDSTGQVTIVVLKPR